jgi:hypothetical protein
MPIIATKALPTNNLPFIAAFAGNISALRPVLQFG